MSFFENPWWKGKQDLGGLLTGFGQNIVDNIVPFQQGEDGNLMPREGYDPYNLTNIGLLGMQSGMGYVPGRTAMGGQTEYTGNFADYIGNINRSLQGQMMNQQKLLDSSLARQLTGAKIGALKRKNLMPEMFKWDEMVNGKRVTKQLIMEGGKSRVVTVDKDAPLTSKAAGTVTGTYSYTDPKTNLAMKTSSVVQPDSSIKQFTVVDPAGLKPLHTDRQSALVNINTLNTANEELAKTGYDPLGPAIKNSMYAVIADKQNTDTERMNMYKDVWTEYSGKAEEFESAKLFIGSAQPKGSPNQPAIYTGGLYEDAEAYAKDVTNYGWVGAAKRMKDSTMNFLSLSHQDTDATKFNTLIDAIKFRANSLKASSGGLKISSRLMDTQREKEWLSELSGLNIKSWTANPKKAEWNLAMLKKVEREMQGRRAKSMAMTIHGASQIPWLKKQDELMGGRMFGYDPTGQSNKPSSWQSNLR